MNRSEIVVSEHWDSSESRLQYTAWEVTLLGIAGDTLNIFLKEKIQRNHRIDTETHSLAGRLSRKGPVPSHKLEGKLVPETLEPTKTQDGCNDRG